MNQIRAVQIYNSMGKLVESKDAVASASFESRFIGTKGLYVVQVKTKDKVVSRKIVVY
jgi:hypothetical protein